MGKKELDILTSSVVIIPAYEPPVSLVSLVDELCRQYGCRVLVVNDGSGPFYDSIFEKLRAVSGCTVLTLSENHGKGYALKTAFRWITRYHNSNNEVYITADCDGQHAVKDIVRVAAAAAQASGTLVLGTRDFSLSCVPRRSRFGNRAMSRLFRFLFGHKLSDTQTGLRAFDGTLLPLLLRATGDGFDYETDVLIRCRESEIPIAEVHIETTYRSPEGTKQKLSHFSPVADSLRILSVFLRAVGPFILCASLSAFVDISAFYFLSVLIPHPDSSFGLLISTVGARLLSSAVNLFLNGRYVFGRTVRNAWKRYYVLWGGRLLLSYGFTLAAGTFIKEMALLTAVKAVFDLFLSVLSFRLQKFWVFARNEK